MSNATQGTIKDGSFTTMSLIGKIASTNYNTGTLIIKGNGGLSLENGTAYIGGNIITDNAIQSGTIQVNDGAVAGYILRSSNSPIGKAIWTRDLDDRIFGDYGGDINFQFGNFGIGISFPTENLHVKENIRTDKDLIFGNTSANISFPSSLTINTDKFYLSSQGLGIGITATERLDVGGNIKLTGNIIKDQDTYVLPTINNTDILVAVTSTQTLYNKTLDKPFVQGNIDLQNSGRIINVNNPIFLQDVATKDYVDNFIQGLDPQESVIDKDIQIPPQFPSDKDRYIVAVGSTSLWNGQDNNIAQYSDLLNAWEFIIPDKGTMTIVEDEFRKYIYNGTSWILFDTLTRHSDLQGLANDDHPQYIFISGRSGGTIIYGGSDPSDNLTLYSTNNTPQGNVIIQPESGFVSIGTTNPSELLHIQSQNTLDSVILIDTRNNNTNSKLVLQNNNDITKAWEIIYQGSTDNFVIEDTNVGERIIIENGVSGPIRFGSGNSEWARLQYGYLGIGTTNPLERLTIGNLNNELDETILVQANNDAKLILNSNISNLDNNDTSIIELRTKNSTESSSIALVGNDNQFADLTHANALLLTAPTSDIQFATNKVNLTIINGGNIGINNDEPNSLLSLNSNLDSHNGLTLGATTDIGIKIGQSTTNYMDIRWNYNVNSNSAYAEITNKNILNDLVLQSNGGSVGIGITNPQDILDIDGNVRLSGTINRGNQVYTLPSDTDTLVGRESTDILRNKELIDTTVYFVNSTDNTKTVKVDINNAVNNTDTTLRFIQTQNRVLTFPDNNDTIIGASTAISLSNKNLSGNVITDLISGDGSVVFSPVSVSGDTVAYLDATQTLSNKTLNSPNINGTGQFNNDLIVEGNLIVNGEQTIINSTIVAVEDGLTKYAKNNVADTIDIGFYACYIETGITKMTGFFRDATDKKYKLFNNLEASPLENVIDTGATGYTKAELIVGTLNTDNITHDNDLLINTNQAVFKSNGQVGIFTASPNADLHVNGTLQINSQLYVKNSNVGIHNSNPVSKLDIIGSARIRGSPNSVLTGTVDPDGTTTLVGTNTLFLTELVPGDKITIGAETRTVLAIASNTSLTVSSALPNVAATTATRLPALFIFEDNLLDAQVLITNEGSLGIDVRNVIYPLQIEKQSSSNWSAKFQNGQSTIFMAHDLGLGMNIQTGNVTDTSYALKISNDNFPLLRLQNDKKIGIGTDTPAELLHLHGSIVGDGALLVNAKIGIWEGNTAFTALTHNDVHATNSSYLVKQHNTGESYINSAATKDLHFRINDVEQMTLKPTGRLGIGTSDPTELLHVSGGSMVTGNLHVGGNLIIDGEMISVSASEIKVKDSMFKFADNNTADVIDIGFYAQYNNGVDRYTGLIRNDADKKWYLFQNLSVEPGVTQANLIHSSMEYGFLKTSGLDIHSNSGNDGYINFLDDANNMVSQIISTPDTLTFAISGNFNILSQDNIVASIDNVGNFGVSGEFTSFGFTSNGDGLFNGNVLATGNLIVDGFTSFPNLQTNNIRFNVTNITSDLTIGTTYSYICADASGGDIIITLPVSHNSSDPSLIGYSFNFIKMDSSPNKVFIQRSGGDLIDGVYTQIILEQQYQRLKLNNIGGPSSVGIWLSD